MTEKKGPPPRPIRKQLAIYRIAEHYGLGNQLFKTEEELSELLEAVTEYLDDPNAHTAGHVIEEIADVEIMLEQLKFLKFPRESVDSVKRYKIQRQLERIQKEREA